MTEVEKAAAAAAAEEKGHTKEDLQIALKAERESRKALKTQLDELNQWKQQQQEATAAAQQKADEAKGEYKSLYEQLQADSAQTAEKLTALQEKETSRIETLTAANTARIKDLPEHLRLLVPEGLAPDAAAAQISQLEALGAKDDRPKGGRAGSGGNQDADAIPAEIKSAVEAEAKSRGRDPTAWYKAHKPRWTRKLKALTH